jgi:hypothetical protein
MTLQLNREAGYGPVYTGPLRNAGMVFAISEGGMGPFVYRIAPPDQLVSGKE